MKTKTYEKELARLQIALVETQAALIEQNAKVLIVFEGRDAAGKDGTIKRIVEYMAPRNTRVVALPKPSDREASQWFFQRYVAQLPAGGEVVLFNRSWYNRGGVEKVMGFSTPEQQARFLDDAPEFEHMLVQAGTKLVKFWLDISREEQAERLAERVQDPLKRFKISPLDAEAQKRWDAYTAARDEMLARTHSGHAPWTCVRNDKKKDGRIAMIRHLLRQTAPAEIAAGIEAPDPDVLFGFEPTAATDGRLAR